MTEVKLTRWKKTAITSMSEPWMKVGDHPDVVPYPRSKHPPSPHEPFCAHCTVHLNNHGYIDTLEGGHIVCPGDRIVHGVVDERYPIKPDVVEKSYQRIEDSVKSYPCDGCGEVVKTPGYAMGSKNGGFIVWICSGCTKHDMTHYQKIDLNLRAYDLHLRGA